MESNPQANASPAQQKIKLGEIPELVFDDNPLDSMLVGGEATRPTPASVMALWNSGVDRSDSCLSAMIAILANDQGFLPPINDHAAAEQCLRQVLDGNHTKSELEQANCLCALSRLLQARDQLAEVEPHLRRALEIRERVLGCNDNLTMATVRQLDNFLAAVNHQEEAARLRNWFRARRLAGQTDISSLWNIRDVALDMFLLGQYAEAETIYRDLLEKKFDIGSTHCHLARVYFMTGQEEDARREVCLAIQVLNESPVYVHARTRFLETLMHMLSGDDWKPAFVELDKSLSESGVHMDWKIQTVLDHLKPRITKPQFELMTAAADAICLKANMDTFRSNPILKEICESKETLVPSNLTTVSETATSATDPFSQMEIDMLIAERHAEENTKC